MAIFDLFSKRQKKLRGDIPDVYTYDKIPIGLRVQIVYILKDALGGEQEYYTNPVKVKGAYKFIVDALCREYGTFRLPHVEEYGERNYFTELNNHFLQEDDIEKTIDIIELSFWYINIHTRNVAYLCRRNCSEYANKAIKELNERFKEHGVGYQFVENEIIRIDSELLHVEAVKPALKLLNQKDYQGAQQEFLSAFEHYRHGRNKEALNDCLKAFESTMKVICGKRNWVYRPKDTARDLVKICFDNELIPSFWQQQLISLRSMLESSIPTGRNKLGGHGQGSTPISVPDYLVAYMLHMTASTVVFLTTAEKNLP